MGSAAKLAGVIVASILAGCMWFPSDGPDPPRMTFEPGVWNVYVMNGTSHRYTEQHEGLDLNATAPDQEQSTFFYGTHLLTLEADTSFRIDMRAPAGLTITIAQQDGNVVDSWERGASEEVHLVGHTELEQGVYKVEFRTFTDQFEGPHFIDLEWTQE